MYKKEYVWTGLLIGSLLICGCKIDYNESNESRIEHTGTDNQNVAQEIDFPDIYEKEAGKVKFSCSIEVPDHFDTSNFYEMKVESTDFFDVQVLLDGVFKEKEKREDSSYDEPNSYLWNTYTDDSTLYANENTVICQLVNSFYYSNNYDKLDQYGIENFQEEFLFSSVEKSEEQVISIIEQLGFQDELYMKYAAIPYTTAQQWEEHLNVDGEREESLYKQSWSETDNAYIFYGYQQVQKLPVCSELMLLGGELSRMNVLNAPVHAIVTEEGIISLELYDLYQISVGERRIQFCSFDEIAESVERKLNDMLDETTYHITLARLCLVVRHGTNQLYEVVPAWYLEGSEYCGEDVSGDFIMFVNAETCKEIVTG